MSLFQCEQCGCCENTALSFLSCRIFRDSFDWAGREDMREKLLCSACSPESFKDGKTNKKGGEWHGQFERVFLPLGKFKTNQVGNLAHIETGDENYRKYAINTKEQ